MPGMLQLAEEMRAQYQLIICSQLSIHFALSSGSSATPLWEHKAFSRSGMHWMAENYSREWGQQADAADTNMSLRSPGRMLCYGDSMSFSGAGWSLAYSLMAASGRCLLYS